MVFLFFLTVEACFFLGSITLIGLVEFLTPQLWTANISSREGGKDSKIDLCKMSWNILSPYNILAIRARYKPISAWRSITNRYYLPQPFLNMTENEYKKKSFARFCVKFHCLNHKNHINFRGGDMALNHMLTNVLTH